MIDALSSAIAHLDLRSMPGTRLEASCDWSLRFSINATLKFASVVKGQVWITVAGRPPVRLTEGDVFFLTNGAQYVIGSHPELLPQDGLSIFNWGAGGTARLYGDDTILVGGAIDIEHAAASPLFSLLPDLTVVKLKDPAADPLRIGLSLLAMETKTTQFGRAAAERRLAELVVVYALRAMMDRDTERSGVVSALADPFLGRAIGLMHQDARRRWTVAELARAVGLSRAAFADRFAKKLGSPPQAYLTQRRLDRARSELAHGEKLVAKVAHEAGYGSESAFGLAFKRRFGVSPARYRALQRSG
jgi:AraC-like DNA-binding protein